MATHNGQRYLAEQLDSICAQTHTNWAIWISDDGSDDDTRQILSDYQCRLGDDKLIIHSGPCKGYSANFLLMVCRGDPDGTYYAYSDQDDIWEPNKLQQAIAWLETIPAKTPALYCGRTRLVNAQNHPLGYSPLFKKPAGFLNALIQNMGGGNTMVFNHSALSALREAGAHVAIVAHDWWTYMLVSGVGGVVFYDAVPTIRYRQHANNLIGSNVGWYARLSRVTLLFKGRFKGWNDLNFQALLSIEHLLTDDNRRALNGLIGARKSSMPSRMLQVKRTGIYRQTWLGNMGLIAAVFLKKM
ncbi:MAG TPA: glycosyl transferase family 2 [Legionella sp.]|nr:glycosyl transferase family 2 [Legionella sp.]